MTSTNDSKDVINTIEDDAEKGKPKIVDLNKSSERDSATLKSLDSLNDLAFPARANVLSAAWRAASVPPNLPHILRSLYRFTLILLLQDQWPRSDDAVKLDLIKALEGCAEAVEKEDAEDVNAKKIRYLLQTAKDPWHHPVLLQIMRGDQPQPQDVVEWVRKEGCAGAVERLRQLSSMGGTAGAGAAIRLSRALLLQSMPNNTRCSALDSLLVLLRKQGKTTDCINEIKALDPKEALAVIGRLATRDRSSGRLWKYAHDTSLLCAQVLLAACVVRPLEEKGADLAALSSQLTSLYTSRPHDLPPSLRKLLKPAETAAHIFIVCQAVQHQFGKDMLPLICELYIRVLTKGLNELEQVKLEKDEDLTLSSLRQLASWFLSLAEYLSFSIGVSAECILTAFSIYPSKQHYKKVQDCWTAMEKENIVPVKKDTCLGTIEDDMKIILNSGQENKTNEEKISTAIKELATLGLNKSSEVENGSDCPENEGDSGLISKAVLDSLLEGEFLGIDADLCKDLLVLLSGPRLRMLTWDSSSWEVLSGHCLFYMADTDEGTRTTQKELKYLHLDYSTYEYKEPDVVDVYHGIEKGYEHHLELDEDDWEEIEYEEAIRKKEREKKSHLTEEVSAESDYHQRAVNKKSKKKLIKKKQSQHEQLPSSKGTLSVRTKHEKGKCPKKQNISIKEGSAIIDANSKPQHKKSNSALSSASITLLKPIIKIKNNIISGSTQWITPPPKTQGLSVKYANMAVPQANSSKPSTISIKSVDVNSCPASTFQKPVEKLSTQPSFFRLQMEKFEESRKREIETELARSNATIKTITPAIQRPAVHGGLQFGSDFPNPIGQTVHHQITGTPNVAKKSSLLTYRKQKFIPHTTTPEPVKINSVLKTYNLDHSTSSATASIHTDSSMKTEQSETLSIDRLAQLEHSKFSVVQDQSHNDRSCNNRVTKDILVRKNTDTKIKNFWQYLDTDKPIDFHHTSSSVTYSNIPTVNHHRNLSSGVDFDSESLIKATVIENPLAKSVKPARKLSQKVNLTNMQMTNIKVRNPCGLDVSPEKLLSYRNYSRKQNLSLANNVPLAKIKNNAQIQKTDSINAHQYQSTALHNRVNQDVDIVTGAELPLRVQVTDETPTLTDPKRKIMNTPSYEQFLADLQFSVNAGQETRDKVGAKLSDKSRLQHVKEAILKKIDCNKTIVKIKEFPDNIVVPALQLQSQIDMQTCNVVHIHNPPIGTVLTNNKQHINIQNQPSVFSRPTNDEKNDSGLKLPSDKKIEQNNAATTELLLDNSHTVMHNLNLDSKMLQKLAMYDVKLSYADRTENSNLGLDSKKEIKKIDCIPQTYARKNHRILLKKQSAVKPALSIDQPQKQVNCDDNKVPLRISTPINASTQSNIVFKAADDLHKLLSETNESRPRAPVRQPKAKSRDRNDLASTISKLTASCGLVVKVKNVSSVTQKTEQQTSITKENCDKDRVYMRPYSPYNGSTNEYIKRRIGDITKMKRIPNFSDYTSHTTIKKYSQFKSSEIVVEQSKVDKFVPKSPIKILNNTCGVANNASSKFIETLRVDVQNDVISLPKVNIISHIRLPSFSSLLKKNVADKDKNEHNLSSAHNIDTNPKTQISAAQTDRSAENSDVKCVRNCGDGESDTASSLRRQSYKTSQTSINHAGSNVKNKFIDGMSTPLVLESCNQSIDQSPGGGVFNRNIEKTTYDKQISIFSQKPRQQESEVLSLDKPREISARNNTNNSNETDDFLTCDNSLERSIKTDCRHLAVANDSFSVLITNQHAESAVRLMDVESNSLESHVLPKMKPKCDIVKSCPNVVNTTLDDSLNSNAVDHLSVPVNIKSKVVNFNEPQNTFTDNIEITLSADSTNTAVPSDDAKMNFKDNGSLKSVNANKKGRHGDDSSAVTMSHMKEIVEACNIIPNASILPNFKSQVELAQDYNDVCKVAELDRTASVVPILPDASPNTNEDGVVIDRQDTKDNEEKIHNLLDISSDVGKGNTEQLIMEHARPLSSLDTANRNIEEAKDNIVDKAVKTVCLGVLASFLDREKSKTTLIPKDTQTCAIINTECDSSHIETVCDTDKPIGTKLHFSKTVTSLSLLVDKNKKESIAKQINLKNEAKITKRTFENKIDCDDEKSAMVVSDHSKAVEDLFLTIENNKKDSKAGDCESNNIKSDGISIGDNPETVTVVSAVTVDSLPKNLQVGNKISEINQVEKEIINDKVSHNTEKYVYIEVPPLSPLITVNRTDKIYDAKNLFPNSSKGFSDESRIIEFSPEKNTTAVVPRSKKLLIKGNKVLKNAMGTMGKAYPQVLKGRNLMSPPKVLEIVNLISDDDSGSDVEIISYDPLSASGDGSFCNPQEKKTKMCAKPKREVSIPSMSKSSTQSNNKRVSSISRQQNSNKKVKHDNAIPIILTVVDGFLKDMKISQIPLADKIKLQMVCKVNLQVMKTKNLPSSLENKQTICNSFSILDHVKHPVQKSHRNKNSKKDLSINSRANEKILNKSNHTSQRKSSCRNLNKTEKTKNLEYFNNKTGIKRLRRITTDVSPVISRPFTRRTKAQLVADSGKICNPENLTTDSMNDLKVEPEDISEINVDLNSNNTKVPAEEFMTVKEESPEIDLEDSDKMKHESSKTEPNVTNRENIMLKGLESSIVKDSISNVDVEKSLEVAETEECQENRKTFLTAFLNNTDESVKPDVVPKPPNVDLEKDQDMIGSFSSPKLNTPNGSEDGESPIKILCSNISWNNFEDSLVVSTGVMPVSPCPDLLSSASDEEFCLSSRPDVISHCDVMFTKAAILEDANLATPHGAHLTTESPHTPLSENELLPIPPKKRRSSIATSLRQSIEELPDNIKKFPTENLACSQVKTYQKSIQCSRKRKNLNSQMQSKKPSERSVLKIDLPHSSCVKRLNDSKVTDLQIYDSALSLRQVLVGDGQDNFSDGDDQPKNQPDADAAALQFELKDFLCDLGAPGDPSQRSSRNSFYSPIFSDPLPRDKEECGQTTEDKGVGLDNGDVLSTNNSESPKGFAKGSDSGEVALSGAPAQRPTRPLSPASQKLQTDRCIRLQVDLENFLNGATVLRRAVRDIPSGDRVLTSICNEIRTKERSLIRLKKSLRGIESMSKLKQKSGLNLISDSSRDILSRVPGIRDLDHILPLRTATVVRVVQLGQPPVVGGTRQSPLPVTPTRPPTVTGEYLNASSNSAIDYQSPPSDRDRDSESDPKVNDVTENVIRQGEALEIDDVNRDRRSEENSIIDISRNDNGVKCHTSTVTVSDPIPNTLIVQPPNNVGRVSLDGPVQLVFATSQSVSQSSFVMATDSIADIGANLNLTSSAGFVPVSRAQTLVNILSQKIIRPPVSGMQTQQVQMATFAKGAPISALSLQQALAQILPPPLSQPSSDGSGSASHPTGPQVVHIVQGKSGQQPFGGLLVDGSQQSIMSASGAAQVLHIVQGKTTSTGNTNILTQSQLAGATFGGLSLVESGSQQAGNQVLHIVNTGAPNKNNSAAAQLLKRVNLLTSITNSQGNNEQKMVQFVCKAADGKAIQVNAQHQRGMVLRLQPIENSTPTVLKPTESQLNLTAPIAQPSPKKSSPQSEQSQQEIKSRSVYEENYAKFIQNSSNKLSPIGTEKSTSLPKFNQAFGKSVFQESNESTKTEEPSPEPASNQTERNVIQDVAAAISSAQTGLSSGPPLLIRKTQSTTLPQNLAQQMKHSMAPVNIQTMHGGVIYTRQIPVNIGGGQTINLITVPGADFIDEAQLQAIQKRAREKAANPGEPDQSTVKIVSQDRQKIGGGQTETGSEETDRTYIEQVPNTVNAHQLLAQMRIKVPMLSKGGTQMMAGTRVVRPVLQIQRNVIPGTNPAVYQQLVLTTAPPLRAPTPVPAQPQPARPPRPATTPHQESNLSSSTLEQLREFDMVLEQVKERSTVQPGSNGNSFSDASPQRQNADNGSLETVISQPTTQREVVYSIGPNQTVNVTYVNQKVLTSVPAASTMYVQSPESSATINVSQQNSPSIQMGHSLGNSSSLIQQKVGPNVAARVGSKSIKSKSGKPAAVVAGASSKTTPAAAKTSLQKPLEDEQTTQRILYILAEYKEQVENSPDKDKPAPRRRSNPPTNPSSSSKRKKGGSSKRGGSGQSLQEMSPPGGDDAGRTMGSEDSSCGLSQGECADNSTHAPESPQGSPRKAAGKLIFQQEPDPNGVAAVGQTQRNVIIADGQTIAMTRPGPGKTTAVLMPANYLLPVSMMKGGQQITIVTNQGPKVLNVPHGDTSSPNALFLQRLINPAGLKPMLTRPGQVRQVRLPANTVQTFNLTAAPNTSQDGGWIGTNSLNNQQPKLLVEYAPNVTVGNEPNLDLVKSETSDMQLMKEESSSVGGDSCAATPRRDTAGDDLNGKTDSSCVYVGSLDGEGTREPIRPADQILHQIHVSKAPANTTLNLIQVHSLNSGEPGKIYSVQNQAGLSSLLQLATKTSLGQAFQTVNLQGLTRDSIKLSTDVQECAQNLMLVRKQPQQVQHYETQYSMATNDTVMTDNQDLGQLKTGNSAKSPTAPEGVYGLGTDTHGIDIEDSHHSIIKSAGNGDADIPWSMSSNGGGASVTHGGSTSPSYVSYGDSPSRMHQDDQQDCDIPEADGVEQSNIGEASQVLHHSYSPEGSPPGPRHLYHKMFITNPAKKVYGSSGHIMAGGGHSSPSLDDDKQFSQHMKKESAVSTVTLHTSNSASFTIHHHHQQHQRDRDGNGENEAEMEMEMESSCVDSREGVDGGDVIRGGVGVDGHSRSNIISGHHTAASLRHKYALLEHELRLQKSLSEECEDLGVDSPSASDLFPEAELLFAASPSSQFDQSQDGCVPPQHHQTQHQSITPQSSSSIITHHHNMHQNRHSPIMMMMSGREHHDRLSNCDHHLSEESSRMLDEEHILDEGGEESDFARMHPNTTFHSGEIELVDDTEESALNMSYGGGLPPKGGGSRPSQRTGRRTETERSVIEGVGVGNHPAAIAYPHSVETSGRFGQLVSDDNSADDSVNSREGGHGAVLRDSVVNRDLNLSSAEVSGRRNAAQVIRRTERYDPTGGKDESDDNDPSRNGSIFPADGGGSRPGAVSDVLKSLMAERDGATCSSPERHSELFWESNSNSDRSEENRPTGLLDFSSEDSDKCCKSPASADDNSTDSGSLDSRPADVMPIRLNSVIKSSPGAADGPILHGALTGGSAGAAAMGRPQLASRFDDSNASTSPEGEGRRMAWRRGPKAGRRVLSPRSLSAEINMGAEIETSSSEGVSILAKPSGGVVHSGSSTPDDGTLAVSGQLGNASRRISLRGSGGVKRSCHCCGGPDASLNAPAAASLTNAPAAAGTHKRARRRLPPPLH